MLETGKTKEYTDNLPENENDNINNNLFLFDKKMKRKNKVLLPLNTDRDGCCLAIKTSYSRMCYANFLGHQHDGYVATAICEYESE